MNKFLFLCQLLMTVVSTLVAQSNAQDVVFITEIMFDPNPAVGQPEAEYVELYNPSSDTVILSNWIWKVGDRSVELPNCSVLPEACLLLVPPSAKDLFSTRTVALSKWLTLTNSGQYVVLKDDTGRLVHFATYSPALFNDALQRDGGYSLELQQISEPCGADSWKPTRAPSGGTPGVWEAHSSDFNSQTEFAAAFCGFPETDQLVVHLNACLHPAASLQEIKLEMDDTLCSCEFYHDRTDQLVIDLNGFLPSGIQSVKISGSVASCSGMALSERLLKWGLPELPDSGDVLFSEIMFEPDDGQVEYVELLNHSDRVIELNDLLICTVDEDREVRDYSDQGSGSHLLLPGDYAVLTPDQIGMLRAFPATPFQSLHERKDLPPMSNSGGRLFLMNQHHQLMDEAIFRPGMHDPRIRETRGVALERLSFEYAGNQEDNWYSTASQGAGGTPGCSNSLWVKPWSAGDNGFWLESEIFCASCSSLPHQAILHVLLDDHGYFGELEVRNLSGMLVAEAFSWGLLPASGILTWNGADDDDQQLPAGIYVLVLNYRHPDGRKGRWKQAVGLMNY